MSISPLPLGGIHHVTAITSSAASIYQFFTRVLGLRLVKKTVNQDDVRAYHLFFADDRGNPGTDMTFFDFGMSTKAVRGTNEIYRTSFRVKTDESLQYWLKRFQRYQVKHEPIKTILGRKWLNFVDFDEQMYTLVSDEGVEGVPAGEPWHLGPVPDEFAIIGLGPIFIRVNDANLMDTQLTKLMGLTKVAKDGSLTLYEMAPKGNGAGVIIDFQRLMGQAIQGYGTIHHAAFRIKNRDELEDWRIHLLQNHIPNSGFVDRYYFQSLYARVYPRVLFEFATDGPGFIDEEEPYETLGEALSIPPHLKVKADLIKQMIKPLNTKRSGFVFPKEY
ncbi:MAG: VOC family protein [Bacilli bacterium]